MSNDDAWLLGLTDSAIPATEEPKQEKVIIGWHFVGETLRPSLEQVKARVVGELNDKQLELLRDKIPGSEIPPDNVWAELEKDKDGKDKSIIIRRFGFHAATNLFTALEMVRDYRIITLCNVSCRKDIVQDGDLIACRERMINFRLPITNVLNKFMRACVLYAIEDKLPLRITNYLIYGTNYHKAYDSYMLNLPEIEYVKHKLLHAALVEKNPILTGRAVIGLAKKEFKVATRQMLSDWLHFMVAEYLALQSRPIVVLKQLPKLIIKHDKQGTQFDAVHNDLRDIIKRRLEGMVRPIDIVELDIEVLELISQYRELQHIRQNKRTLKNEQSHPSWHAFAKYTSQDHIRIS